MQKFYIDFEATQPGNEIIAFGVVSNDGLRYQTLVKPKHSTVTPYITQITGITQEEVERFDIFENELNRLGEWCSLAANGERDWEFHCYGWHDRDFVKTSIKYVNFSLLNERGLLALVSLQNRMIDDAKDISKFFCGNISLIKAYNFAKNGTFEQMHDPLEDALMLKYVRGFINDRPPLSKFPFTALKPTIHYDGLGVCPEDYVMPSGKFFCQGTGKNAKPPREFESCDEAINWLIMTFCPNSDRNVIRRDRMAIKIMAAIRKNQTYQGFKWRREK